MTEEQQQTLRAVLNCLIPPDDFPGAWDAGVSDYLTRQFQTDLAPRFDFYCSGLDGLDSEAAARFGNSFSLLATTEQVSILESVETGEVVTEWTIPPRVFFDLLVNTTAEGYYSNPEQGGNRGAVSWAMVGFEENHHE